MIIWYSTPFLLALLAWGVATRKYPEEKEKWNWLALGVCSGAVLMFGMVFFSEDKDSGSATAADNSGTAAVTIPTKKLQNDEAVEILPATKIRVDQTLTVGSLQITLLGVEGPRAILQFEPSIEPINLSANTWTFTSHSVKRVGFEVILGQHLSFCFQDIFYRLGLVELPRAFFDFVPADVTDAFVSHAVVRIIQLAYEERINPCADPFFDPPNDTTVSGVGEGTNPGRHDVIPVPPDEDGASSVGGDTNPGRHDATPVPPPTAGSTSGEGEGLQ